MKMRMINDRVLIKPIRNSEYSEGGIFIDRATTTFTKHSGSDEQLCQGEVVEINSDSSVKKGDYVAFSDTCHRPAFDDMIVIRNNDVMLISNEPFKHVEIKY